MFWLVLVEPPLTYKAVPFAKGTEMVKYVMEPGGQFFLTRPSPSRRGLKCVLESGSCS